MLRTHLTAALRSLARRRGVATLNLLGLSLGFTCCLLIGLYVRHEHAYDRHHAEADRIYRVAQTSGEGDATAWVGGAMAPRLEREMPAVEAVARLHRTSRVVRREGAERGIEEDDVVYADPSVFDVFTLPFERGAPETALAEPDALVLTERAARRHFGDGDPLGATLLVGDRAMTVTGVLRDLPATSHLQVEFMASLGAFKLENWGTAEGEFGSFWWPSTYTYVRLRAGADAASVDAELPSFIARHREAEDAARYVPFLQPLTSIHLHSDLGGEWRANGSAAQVYLFSLIAAFVLLLACVNFTNLATARAAERSVEVGVRKAMGAARRDLMAQFYAETLLLSGCAFVLSVLLVEALAPRFADLAARPLTFSILDPAVWGVGAALVLATGLVAGSYPALVLSSFEPVRVMTSGGGTARGAVRLRRGLVVFQFTLSIALLAGTAIAWQQLGYLRASELGFDRERVVVLDRNDADYDVLSAALREEASVAGVATAWHAPGTEDGGNPQVETAPFTPPERLTAEGSRAHMQPVGPGYFELLGIPLVAGRTLADDRAADVGFFVEREENFGGNAVDARGFVVNASFAAAWGWTPEEALGKPLRVFTYENGQTYSDQRGAIVGVVADFHTASLRESIAPTVFTPAAFPEPHGLQADVVLVKLRTGDLRAAMDRVEAVWAEVQPERTIEASFLDADLEAQYRADERFGMVVTLFSAIALFVACLGLLGLAAHAAARRTKEIGIRKVLGASVSGLVALLAREFVALVAVAAVLAAPIAYLGMERWLSTFAYRVDVEPGLFLLAGGVALAVALLTVGGYALRAARMNPTEALRYE